MNEDMRQRSRVYSIVLARVLPTHAEQPAATPSRLLPTRTHARTHAHLGLHCSGPRRQPRRSIASAAAMRCVCDGAVPLCNGQQTACDREHARWARQRTRDTMRQGTCGLQKATADSHRRACNVRRCDVGQRQTARGMQQGTRGLATENRPHATENVRHATKKGHADKIQRPAMPQTTRKTQRARHHRKMGNKQQTTCDMHEKCTRRHAAAEDTDAVVDVPCPYDRRHAAAVSRLFDCPGASTPYARTANSQRHRHLATHTHAGTQARTHTPTSVCTAAGLAGH